LSRTTCDCCPLLELAATVMMAANAAQIDSLMGIFIGIPRPNPLDFSQAWGFSVEPIERIDHAWQSFRFQPENL
jgi:hypothetical protein